MLLTHRMPSFNRQRGVALVMAMIFLLLLTLLGVTSMSTSTLEEKMTTNTKDRNLAFQAAETALVAAEAWIGSQGAEPAVLATPEAAKGTYPASAPPTLIWETVDWSGANVISYPCTPAAADPTDAAACDTADATKAVMDEVATQPKYIIEWMDEVNATPRQVAYRITAMGTGSSDSSVVMLQSTYVMEY